MRPPLSKTEVNDLIAAERTLIVERLFRRMQMYAGVPAGVCVHVWLKWTPADGYHVEVDG